jgi:hypothetical protein
MSRIKKPTTTGVVPNKTEQIKEIIKCGSDASYFISRYVKISHPTKGTLPFKTFPYQDKCLNAFQKNRFVITNKSRQLGLSTLSAAYSLWMAVFQKEKNILVIATRLEVAKNFIKKVNSMYSNLPKWLVMPQVKAQSVRYLEFSNGSKIQAVPTGTDAGRSEALSLLIIDEAAHVEGIDELWLGLWPTLSTGGSAILISSPSGVGTLFHKIWVGAKEGEDGDGNPNPGQGTNNFYRIELPWTVHPERDQKWFDEQRAEIISAKGERGVAQELLCVFNSSGDTFLKTEFLDALENNCSKPIAHYGPAGNVWIWKYAEPEHKYLITADVARGDAGDFSTIQVIDTTKDEQVAEFQGKIPPDDLAELMLDLGFKYNQALLCPELNSFGLMTSTALKKSNYKNLFYEKFSRNIFMTSTNDDIKDEMPGLTTSAKNREEMLAKLEGVLRNQKIRIYSIRLVNEIKTFIWKNNKAQAMKGYNDDLIMSLAIACNLYEAAGTTTYDSLEIAMSMLQGISRKSNFMEKNGNWAEKNTYMPAIIPTNGSVLQTHERLRNNSVNKSQNWNDPILKNFKWVID